MLYGFGTLRDNQRTRLCLIWINCMWKKSVDNEALVVWPSRDFRRDMTWRGMTWHDVAGRGMMWRDVTWRDMTWHDVAWCDMTIKLTIKRWSCDRPATFARLLINLEHFCQVTNVWVTSKTSWTGRWPEFLRSPKHGSSVGMSAKDSLTSKT